MHKALIDPRFNRVCEIVANEEAIFAVAAPLFWIDAGNDVTDRWTWQDGELVPPQPQPDPVPQSITMRQLLIGLQADAWVTPMEAEAWAARTALPANVQAVIDAMPEAERPAARITAFTMSAAYRDDPMLLAAAQAAMPDATPDEIAAALDDAFRRWSLL